MVVCGKRQAPAALPAVKTRYPLYRRLSGPQDWSGRVRKISPPTGGPPFATSTTLFRSSQVSNDFMQCIQNSICYVKQVTGFLSRHALFFHFVRNKWVGMQDIWVFPVCSQRCSVFQAQILIISSVRDCTRHIASFQIQSLNGWDPRRISLLPHCHEYVQLKGRALTL
jgi:hypothetical protein